MTNDHFPMTKEMSEMKSEDSDYIHIEETYDRGSRDYGDHFKRPHQFIEPERQRFIQQLSAGSKILDCGCGPGMDAEKFCQLGYSVTAQHSRPRVNIRPCRSRSAEIAYLSIIRLLNSRVAKTKCRK